MSGRRQGQLFKTTGIMVCRMTPKRYGGQTQNLSALTTAAGLLCILFFLSAMAATAAAAPSGTQPAVLLGDHHNKRLKLLLLSGRVQDDAVGENPTTYQLPPAIPAPWRCFSGIRTTSTAAIITSGRHNLHHIRRLRNHRRQLRRRGLLGPGSAPPRCASRCGGCAPCRAVHVTVPPGTPVTTMEYYPEAWRCKCGNRLYLP